MLRAYCFVLIGVPSLLANDFLKQLTPKDFSVTPPKIIVVPQVKISGPLTCAIPLKELRVPTGSSMDKITAPHVPQDLDKGMLHPSPIPVCAEH